ncbi:MAG: amino acid ABC transporter permease [Acidimicrobiales bacterium]
MGGTPPGADERRPDGASVIAVPVRHPGRWVASIVVAVLAAMLIHALVFSHTVRGGVHEPRFRWGIIGHYFLSHQILEGLVLTLELTALAMAIGIALGIIGATMRLSPNPFVSGSSWIYVWFFRGTPVLVQLLFWYNFAYLFPKLTLGVPFGPAFAHFSANSITPFVAAVIALGLNEGAYMSEIVRAGIISVDEGQNEAAQALGMTRLQILRKIVLPQAMRVIVPVTGNETISMLKTSSLASVITVFELTGEAELIYSNNYEVMELLIVASLWYLIVTTVLTFGQYYVERYFARGALRELPPTPFQRFRRAVNTVGLWQRDVGRRDPFSKVLSR